MADNEQKCTFIGCENRGVPQEGFDFFACEACLEKLGELIEAGQRKQLERHERN